MAFPHQVIHTGKRESAGAGAAKRAGASAKAADRQAGRPRATKGRARLFPEGRCIRKRQALFQSRIVSSYTSHAMTINSCASVGMVPSPPPMSSASPTWGVCTYYVGPHPLLTYCTPTPNLLQARGARNRHWPLRDGIPAIASPSS